MTIECIDLCRSYGGKKALDHVNLKLEGGHIIGLLGPNGSGKTTLIKLICRLLVPTSGQLLINGTPPGPASKAAIAYLPDHCALPSQMRVRQLVQLYQDFFADFDAEAARVLLNRFSISESDVFKHLSKGNQEKLQLILTMSRKASIYILDEPIAGVDPAARDTILETILSTYREDALVLLSTHLISDVETVLDDIVFLKEGQVFLHESAEEIRTRQQSSVDAYFREVFKC